ncbi:MAG: 2-phosphosulfolactate phosphatase, partial [Parabacteroides sp.]|nr:2-phosphosulfolactate phosphatase [Parabacteroides sp.]
MKIDVCFSPALYSAYHDPEAIVVVVDIFRATTTMVAAFHNGVCSIRPVATVEEAQAYKTKGWLVGAERNVKRCDFADFGNSPFDYKPEIVEGKDVAFTTTNGTKAITIAQSAYRVVTGAFINLQAVAGYCSALKRDVIVLCSGWQDKVNIEDTLFGGALVDELLCIGQYEAASDA